MPKTHDRQIEHRTKVRQLSNEDKPTLRQAIEGTNEELIPLFEITPNSPSDLQVLIGSGNLVNQETSRVRRNSDINFGGGNIVFPSSNGGTAVVSPGVDATINVAPNNYLKCLIEISTIGQLSIKQGAQSTSINLATIPENSRGQVSIGFVTLFNDGGTIQPISSEDITIYKVSDDLLNHEVATNQVHGVTGDVVGTSDTQDLSNKTFTNAIRHEAETINASGSVFLGGTKSVIELTGAVDEIANIGVGGFKEFTLINRTGNPIQIINDNQAAAAPTRIQTGTGADVTLAADQSVKFLFSSESTQWYMVGGTGNGSGVGGINYIPESSDAESGLGNWENPDTGIMDITVVEPVNGGLLGESNFRVSVDANAAVTPYRVRVPFTIDNFYVGKKLQISAKILANDANFPIASGEIPRFRVIRQSDSTVMEDFGGEIVKSPDSYDQITIFDADTTEKDYYLEIYAQDPTFLGPYSFDLDNIRISPIETFAIKDDFVFTVTFNGSGVFSTNEGNIGDQIQIPSANVYRLYYDKTLFPSDPICIPTAIIPDGNGVVSVREFTRGVDGTGDYVEFVPHNTGSPGSIAGTDEIQVTFIQKVQDRTTSTLGATTQAKEIYFEAGAPTVSTSPNNPIVFTEISDADGIYNASNGQFTIAREAVYNIEGSYRADVTQGGATFFLFKNGSRFKAVGSNQNEAVFDLSGTFLLEPGTYYIGPDLGLTPYSGADQDQWSHLTITTNDTVVNNLNIDAFETTILQRIITANQATVAGVQTIAFTNIKGKDAQISGNGFIPKKGKYKATLQTNPYRTGHHKLYLYNVNLAQYVDLDTFQYYNPSNVDGSVPNSMLDLTFVANGTDVYEFRLWCESGIVNGFGGSIAARGTDPSGSRSVVGQVTLVKIK